MNWKEWSSWKKKKHLAVVLFSLAYLATIRVRDYSFLEGSFDISSGVPLHACACGLSIGLTTT